MELKDDEREDKKGEAKGKDDGRREKVNRH